MATDLTRRFVRRMRVAGALVVAGLGVQAATLVEAHPFAFLAFLAAGIGLVLGGVGVYVWAWITQ